MTEEYLPDAEAMKRVDQKSRDRAHGEPRPLPGALASASPWSRIFTGKYLEEEPISNPWEAEAAITTEGDNNGQEG